MWAMEYTPYLFTSYQNGTSLKNIMELNETDQLQSQCGKFAKKNLKSGGADQSCSLSIFIVAGILEAKNQQLLREAKGLDDVVKVIFLSLFSLSLSQGLSAFSIFSSLSPTHISHSLFYLFCFVFTDAD